eukprot:Nk52_evm23s225 gene=Nk52_evmTU23s225
MTFSTLTETNVSKMSEKNVASEAFSCHTSLSNAMQIVSLLRTLYPHRLDDCFAVGVLFHSSTKSETRSSVHVLRLELSPELTVSQMCERINSSMSCALSVAGVGEAEDTVFDGQLDAFVVVTDICTNSFEEMLSDECIMKAILTVKDNMLSPTWSIKVTENFPTELRKISLSAHRDASAESIGSWLQRTFELNLAQLLEHCEDRVLDLKQQEEETEIILDQQLSELMLQTQQKGLKIDDILLSSLYLSFHKLTRKTVLPMAMEKHGRDEDVGDVSRTVGWFTNMFPIFIEAGEALVAASSHGKYLSLVKAVRHIRQSIPSQGLGFHAFGSYQDWMPVIFYNFLGHFGAGDGKVKESRNVIEIDDELASSIGMGQNISIPLGLHLTSYFVNGKFKCSMKAKDLFIGGFIDSLSSEMSYFISQVCEEVMQTKTIGYVPSDFSACPLTQNELDKVESVYSHNNIASILSLTSLQEGILYHRILSPGDDPYVTQVSYKINSSKSAVCIKRAVSGVFSSKDIFRMKFLWENLSSPVQVEHHSAAFPFHIQRVDSKVEFEAAFCHTKEEEFKKGFDLSTEFPVRFWLFDKAYSEDYVLVITGHHITVDGWSQSLLRDELQKAVGGDGDDGRVGEEIIPSRAPAGDYCFGDFVSYVSSLDKEDALEYWKEQLGDVEESTVIAAEFKRESVNDRRRVSHSSEAIPFEIVKRLNDVAKKACVSLSTVVQFGFAAFLSLYSQSQKVTYGTVMSGRIFDVSHIEKIVGLFIETVPVKVSFEDEGRNLFAELRSLADALCDAHVNGYIPLQDICACAPSHTPSSPLVNILFSYQNVDAMKNEETGRKEADSVPVLEDLDGRDGTNYDLTFTVAPEDDGWSMNCAFNSGLYSQEFVCSMINTCVSVFDAVGVCNDRDSIKNLRDKLGIACADLSIYERGEDPFVEVSDTICDVVARHAVASPTSPAVVYGEEEMSYSSLVAKASRVRNSLLSTYMSAKWAPLPFESKCCIMSRKNINIVAGLLGIMASGSCYVPLDPEYPKDRVEFIVNETMPSFLLVDEITNDLWRDYLYELEGKGICVLVIEEIVEASSTFEVCNAEDAFLPSGNMISNLAYIIFTSGSTGNPKGVQIEHRSMMHFLQATAEKMKEAPPCRFSSFSSTCFDASIYDIFECLYLGGAVCLIPDIARKDTDLLTTLLTNYKVDSLFAVPSVLGALDPKSLPNIRYVWCGGEVIPESLVEAWKGDRTFFQVYGPTETSVFASCISPSKESNVNHISIGRPLSTYDCLVLDTHLRPVPRGCSGELYISGPTLSRGYLNRPDLTDKAFVPNPFFDHTKHPVYKRMYKTGDLVKVNSCTATLEFVGRRDNQVKIRGVRIEMEEVESAISKLPGIGVSCVVDRTVENVGKILICFYEECESSHAVDSNSIRGMLRGYLPETHIPSFFVKQDALPRNVNKKVDRGACGTLDLKTEFLETNTALETPTEFLVAEIWSSLLSYPVSSKTCNFFNIGGHSLLASKAANMLSQRLACHIPVKYLITTETVEAFASAVESLLHLEQKPDAFAALSLQREMPLSYSQERLVFLHNRGQKSAYNMPVAYRIKGILNFSALEKALRFVVLRHPILRSVYECRDGVYQQYTLEDPELPFSIVAHTTEEDVQRAVLEESSRPFSIEGSLLIRFSVFVCKKDKQFTLMINQHHSISDGWSQDILLRELSDAYKAYCDGGEPCLPPLTYSYLHYAAWERKSFEDGLFEEDLSYWREHLQGCKPLVLPNFLNEDSSQSKTDKVTSVLSDNIAAKLESVAKLHKTTLYAVLLTVCKLVLGFYCTENDIVVGSPVANREMEEMANVLGFFTNTLPLRTVFSSNMRLEQALLAVKDTCTNAFSRASTPLNLIMESVDHRSGSVGLEGMLNVAFTYSSRDGVGNEALSFGTGVEIVHVPLSLDSAKFDLLCGMETTDEDLTIVLEYDAKRLPPTLVRSMMDSLEIVVNVFTNASELSTMTVGHLKILPADKIKHILSHYSPGPERVCAMKTATDDIVHVSSLVPMNEALVYKDTRYSYGEMMKESYATAFAIGSILKAFTAPQRPVVCVSLDRSHRSVIGMLGVLLADAIYMPLDPFSTRQRMEDVLSDAQPRMLLCSERTVEMFTKLCTELGIDTHVHAIEQLSVETVSDKDVLALPVVNPDSTALILYTSGSTGKPKGVQIHHLAVGNIVKFQSDPDHLNIGYDTRMLHYCSVNFDVSIQEMFCALSSGATLVVADEAERKNPELLREMIQHHNVNMMTTTPTVVRALGMIGKPPTCLKTIVTGGEPLTQDIIRSWSPYVQLINQYGPNECTIAQSMHRIDSREVGEKNLHLNIGRPFPSYKIYICDSLGRLVPEGVSGEICISGIGVKYNGYMNLPELSEERFGSNPFNIDHLSDFEKLYKTGDYGYWHADGTMYIRGRIDNQMKINGVRIELEEIEQSITKLRSVKMCCVYPHTKLDGGYKLVAFYTGSASEEEMKANRHHLLEHLHQAAIPGIYVKMEALPVTTNGKVDRKRLQLFCKETVDASDDLGYDEPMTATEEKIRDVWAAVLKVDPNSIGLHQDFFEAGGSSLMTTMLMYKLKKMLNINISLQMIYEHPTIAEIVRCFEQLEDGGVKSQNEKRRQYLQLFRKDDTDGVLCSLSYSQERLVFLHNRGQKSAYNMPVAYRIKGILNFSALEKALRFVVLRHPILRSVYECRDGVYQQYTLEDPELPFSIVAHTTEEDVQRAVLEESSRPFSIEGSLLIRFSVFVCKKDKQFTLMINQHHSISDGWSQDILLRELSDAYKAYCDGGEPCLPPLTYSYLHYAAWERKSFEDGLFEEDLSYWREHLQGCKPLVLPNFLNEDSSQSKTDKVTSVLSDNIAAKLESVAKLHKTTLYAVLLTVCKLVLGFYCTENDIVVGSPVANREMEEMANVLGFFTNTLPLRTVFSSNMRLEQALLAVKDTCTNAFSRASTPLNLIMESVDHRSGSVGLEGMLNVAFTYSSRDGVGNEALSFGTGVEIVHVPLSLDSAKFDLLCGMETTDEDLTIVLEYDAKRLPPTLVRSMMDSLEIVVNVFTNASELSTMTVGHLKILPADKIKHILSHYSPGPERVCAMKTATDDIVHVSSLVPMNEALVYKDTRYSYGEMMKESYATAFAIGSILKAFTAPQRPVVCVSLDRSHRSVIGMLGVLLADAIYMPLDPFSTRQRMEDVLSDAQPRMLLCSERTVEMFTKLCTELGIDTHVHAIEQLSVETVSDKDVLALPVVNPDSTALILYTSGSTGKPKGVQIHHLAVGNIVKFQSDPDHLNIGYDTRMLHYCSVNFDVSIQEMFCALSSGATLVVADEAERKNPELLREMIQHHNVNMMTTTPTVVRALGMIGKPPTCLKTIVTGGEPLTQDIIRSWSPYVQLINQYGPNECTIAQSMHRIDSREVGEKNLHLNIGRPFPSYKIYICDSLGRLVPEGVSGEICISGIGVKYNGYMNLPELSEERFGSNPFNIDHLSDFEKLYKTGDYGYWHADGTMYIRGRIDNQMKINGVRIELEEIEQSITKLRSVKMCCVYPHTKLDGGYKLVAFYTGSASEEEMKANRHHLLEHLHQAAIPGIYVKMEALPVTTNGKVDRKRLQLFCKETVDASDDLGYDEPMTATEEKIRDVWAAVLKVDPNSIGLHQDFFEAGGSSLMTTMLMYKLSKEIGLNATIQTIYEYPTIRELAELVDTQTPSQRNLNRVLKTLVGGSGSGVKRAAYFIPPAGAGKEVFHPVMQKFRKDWKDSKHLSAVFMESVNLVIDDCKSDVGEMCEYYAELIQEDIKTRVPGCEGVLLCGWSFGGVLAMEISEMLLKRNIHCQEIVLLDSYPCESIRTIDELDLGLFFWQMKNSNEKAKASVENIEEPSENMNAHVLPTLVPPSNICKPRRRSSAILCYGSDLSDVALNGKDEKNLLQKDLEARKNDVVAIHEAARNFSTSFYLTKATLFKSGHQPEICSCLSSVNRDVADHLKTDHNNWKEYIENIDVKVMKSCHMNIFTMDENTERICSFIHQMLK